MKKFIFIILLTIFFIPNVFAATCDISLPIENVVSLPTASISTVDKIYYYNGLFYKTVSSASSLTKILVGDNLNKAQINLNLDTLLPFIDTDNTAYSYILMFNASNYQFKLFNSSNNFSIYDSGDMTMLFRYDKATDKITTNLFPYQCPYNSVVTSYNAYSFIQNHMGFVGGFNYSYETCDNSTIEMKSDKELFLFFSSYDIKNLDVFNNIDFSTFTTFQIVALTIGVNILFVTILLFFAYITIKLIFRLWSIVRCLL